MNTITCTDKKLYSFSLRKYGREKKVFWSESGVPYYRRGNARVYLDTVERLVYPYFYETEFGQTGVIGGIESFGYAGCLYVEISEDGETVQLWEQV